MKAGIIPVGSKSVNDILWVNDVIAAIEKKARNQCSVPLKRFKNSSCNPSCAQCGCMQSLEIHHIKPVWVCALEVVLQEKPTQLQDLYEIADKYWRKNGKQLNCHEEINLLWLCKDCHNNWQIATDKYWKTHFETNHRIVFRYRNLKLIDSILAS